MLPMLLWVRAIHSLEDLNDLYFQDVFSHKSPLAAAVLRNCLIVDSGSDISNCFANPRVGIFSGDPCCEQKHRTSFAVRNQEKHLSRPSPTNLGLVPTLEIVSSGNSIRKLQEQSTDVTAVPSVILTGLDFAYSSLHYLLRTAKE